jgi:hypothetical protein
MLPEWAAKILADMGFAGVVIFVQFTAIAGLVAYVKSMQGKADKVYGYRLSERDTLNKVLTDTAHVIEGIVKANEERNDLTEEQAGLIREYENIKDHNGSMGQIIAAMAEAIRVLNSMLLENRTIAQGHVLDVKSLLGALETNVKQAVSNASQAQMTEMRSILGGKTIVERRRVTK